MPNLSWAKEPQWQDGWDARIREVVRRLGYADFLGFLKDHLGEPYGKLLRILTPALGGKIPIMQLHILHMREASAVGDARDGAMDSLVRSLREHVPHGWNRGKTAKDKRAWASAHWVLPHSGTPEWARTTALADRVWTEIEKLNPPDDWCPLGPQDQIVQEAFARGWPV